MSLVTLVSLTEPSPPARPVGPQPPPVAPPAGLALWALGFRPFYLAAALFAAFSVPLWALQFTGWLPQPWLRGPLWHAHEMLFGFTLAVIVGFLFTAGSNWSGQPTPKGRTLMALVALWVLARVLVLSPWGVASMVANVGFAWLAAAGLGRALLKGGNKRNYFFVGLLVLLGAASGVVHAALLWGEPLSAAQADHATRVALDMVLIIMVVMTGRVVPMFTNNGVPGTRARCLPQLEKGLMAGLLLLLPVDALGLHGPWLALALLVLAAATVWRLALWQPWRTRHAPMVWILHAACAWLPLHFGLRAAAEMGWVMSSLATHALTAGTIGALTLGMMTRTARGHTGRLLQAGNLEVAAYAAVLAAAAVRVFLPLLNPAWLMAAAEVSAALWSLAFLLYAWQYTPWLLRARLDGRPG